MIFWEFLFFWDGDNYLRIVGIKHLNENNYKKIRIGHNEILVTGVNHDFDDSTISSKFTDTLKGLDRKHIIDDVIEHFLESHTINSVSNYDFSGKSINVLGNDDVSLKICVPVDMEIAKRIMSKYKHDRDSFVENMSLSDASILLSSVTGKSSYEEDEGRYLFYLSSRDGNVRKFEKEFLIGFIDRMLSDKEIVMTRQDSFDDTNVSMISFLEEGTDDDIKKYVGYGAPSIKVSNNIVPMIESIIIDHNDKVESNEVVRNKVLIRTEEFK